MGHAYAEKNFYFNRLVIIWKTKENMDSPNGITHLAFVCLDTWYQSNRLLISEEKEFQFPVENRKESSWEVSVLIHFQLSLSKVSQKGLPLGIVSNFDL